MTTEDQSTNYCKIDVPPLRVNRKGIDTSLVGQDCLYVQSS